MHSQSVTWKACRTRQMWKGKNTMEICKQANWHLFDFAKINLARKLIYINRKIRIDIAKYDVYNLIRCSVFLLFEKTTGGRCYEFI